MSDTAASGASEAAKTIEWWYNTFKTKPTRANAINCAYLVIEEMQIGPRRKDWNADTIANAMLAFKRIGVPPVAHIGQIIFVEREWVVKFVAFFIEKGWWHNLMDHDEKRWTITLSEGVNLREVLPTHLRGKFSVNP